MQKLDEQFKDWDKSNKKEKESNDSIILEPDPSIHVYCFHKPDGTYEIVETQNKMKLGPKDYEVV